MFADRLEVAYCWNPFGEAVISIDMPNGTKKDAKRLREWLDKAIAWAEKESK